MNKCLLASHVVLSVAIASGFTMLHSCLIFDCRDFAVFQQLYADDCAWTAQVTQMKYRLAEGNGECFYFIGQFLNALHSSF